MSEYFESSQAVEEEVSTPTVEAVAEEAQAVQEEAVTADVQVQEPSEKIDYSRETEGLKKALEAERMQRQQLAEKTQFLEQMMINMSSPKQEQDSQFDPDDIVTYADLQKVLGKSTQQYNEQLQQMKIEATVQAARQTHDDYDEVIELAKDLERQFPNVAAAIMREKNPAEAAYQWGKTHPSYTSKIQQAASQKTVAKIQKNLSSPQTLAGITAGAGTAREVAKNYANMTPEEINAEIRRVKGY